MLERAVAAGGQIEMPVTDMGEMVGSIGFFIDSEGNRIGVHKPARVVRRGGGRAAGGALSRPAPAASGRIGG